MQEMRLINFCVYRTKDKKILISPTRLCLALTGAQSTQAHKEVTEGFIIVESNYRVRLVSFVANQTETSCWSDLTKLIATISLYQAWITTLFLILWTQTCSMTYALSKWKWHMQTTSEKWRFKIETTQ